MAKLKPKKSIPFEFILDELSDLGPMVKPMFGAYGVYVHEQIKVILRDKVESPEDSGIWIATTGEHHQALKKDLPSMRSIEMFGPGPTGWQVVPKDSEDFEEAAFKICEMIRKADLRVGKTPKKKLRKSPPKEQQKGMVPKLHKNRPRPPTGKKSPKTSKKPSDKDH